MKRALLPIAALSLAALSMSQVTKAGAGYNVKVKYKKGATYRYALATKVNMGAGAPAGGNQAMTMSLSQRVVNIQNGITTLEVKATNPQGGNVPPQTVKVDSSGKVVGNSGQNFNILNGLPNRPLKVGETWRSTSALPGLPPGAKANIAYTFRGVKAVGGRQVAQIDYTINLAGPFAMTGKGSTLLDAADGQIRSSILNGDMRIQQGQGGKPMAMKLNVNMKRL